MRTTYFLLLVASLGMANSSRADLSYTFNADAEGFMGVTWQPGSPAGWAGLPGSIMQNHTAGGWQMVLTKEFGWAPGGGSANQQLEMQALANLNSRISFDVMIDGASFPANVSTWFQFAVVGNSDGTAGWTQMGNIFTAANWHNAGDPTLFTQHFDFSFAQMGWQPGDTWFQFWTGANSDTPAPVNFYLDNVTLYVVPEPAGLSLLGLGTALFLLRRRS